MIAWYWLIIAAMLGGMFGAIIAAICIAGGKADAHINNWPAPPTLPPGGKHHA